MCCVCNFLIYWLCRFTKYWLISFENELRLMIHHSQKPIKEKSCKWEYVGLMIDSPYFNQFSFSFRQCDLYECSLDCDNSQYSPNAETLEVCKYHDLFCGVVLTQGKYSRGSVRMKIYFINYFLSKNFLCFLKKIMCS